MTSATVCVLNEYFLVPVNFMLLLLSLLLFKIISYLYEAARRVLFQEQFTVQKKNKLNKIWYGFRVVQYVIFYKPV